MTNVLCPQNIILINLMTCLPATPEVQNTIRIITQLQIEGVELGIFFYGNCTPEQLRDIETNLDIVFPRTISLDRNQMTATMTANGFSIKLDLPVYTKLDRLSTILAYELVNKMGVVRVVICGEVTEAVDLNNIGGNIYNITTRIPRRNFTYLGLFFKTSPDLTVVARKLQTCILPLFRRMHSKCYIWRWLGV